MAIGWLDRPLALWERVRPWLTERRVFWTLFALALLAGLAPIWSVTWPPLCDLGAHVELMDVVGRYDHPDVVYRDVYRLPEGINPNSLTLLVAAWVVPLVDALTLAKLLLSAYALGLPLALLALCRAFKRSDWLAFFAFPLSYNAMWAIGFLNYLLALPMLLLAVALARSLGERGGWKRGLFLAVLLAVLFLTHALAYLMGFALVVAVLALTVRRWSHWARLLPPLVSLPVFYSWYQRKFVQGEATEAGLSFGSWDDTFGAVYKPAESLIAEMHAWGLRFLQEVEGSTAFDEIVFVGLVAIWLLLLAVGRGLGDADGRDGWAFLRLLRRWSLEIVTLCCVVVYFVLPSHVSHVYLLTERTVIVFLLLFAIWPRIARLQRPPALLAGLLVAVSIVYPLVIRDVFERFEREQVGGLPAAIADLPDGSFLSYVMWDRDNPVLHMGALWHMPIAMHALANGGVTDDSFAVWPSCPVQYRPGMTPPRPRDDFWIRPIDARIDHVLVRSTREPLELLEEPGLSLRYGEGHWWLFDVVEADPSTGQALLTGGRGGGRVSWNCPKGFALTGLSGRYRHVVTSLRPHCGPLAADAQEEPQAALGPRFGDLADDGETFRLMCPGPRVVVGLHGRSGRMVDAIGVVCATPSLADGQLSEIVGGPGGDPYDLRCPVGTVATGLRGRAGAAIDGVGIACQPAAGAPD